MKSHILLAVSLMVFHASVSASDPTPPEPEIPTTNSSAEAQAVGVGLGIGVGIGQGGDARATAEGGDSTAAQTQSQAVTLSYKGVRNAPSVALGAGFPTASCQGVAGIGGSGVNGSGLFNFSFTKKECETVVLAQNFAALNMPDVSCEILKTTKAWQRAVEKNPKLAANCAPLAVEEATALPVSITPPDMSQYATKEELERAFRRAVQK